MNLGDIVHKVVTQSTRNIFPVVHEKKGTLLGIILMDDIRPIMFDQTMYDKVLATDVMQTPPSIIDLDTDKMADVMKKFQDSGAWNLPVVKDGKYEGFISKSKLLTAYRRELINYTQ